MIHSFDIFDTCLVRSCGRAESVFDILSKEILGPGINPAAYMDFARERIIGEVRARKLLNYDCFEEVTIAGIYEQCDFSSFTSVPKERIIEKEMEIERKVLVPVRSMLDRIADLHFKGESVLFISDMYLPYDFIVNLLTDLGLFKDGDRVYLSSSIGKTKQSGNLFRYVLDDLALKPSQLEHFGDNKDSDLSVPKSMGISAHMVCHKRSDYEQIMCSRDFSGQFMGVNILASMSKAIRLSVSDTPENRFAADFVAPVFVPFVYSILQNAKNRGLHKLYFFARDAYIFYLIANRFSDDFPEIELHYIYVSRRSLYLPGLEEISFDSISKLFWDPANTTCAEILDRLHMTDVDPEQYTHKGKDFASTLSSLLEDPIFVEKLNQKIREQKELTVKYLIQEGLGEEGCAVIDLTGTRKCHIAVNRLLTQRALSPAFGYYFSVHESRIAGGDYHSLFFEDRYDRNNLNLSLRPHDLFEQYFCITTQDRTCSYRSDGGAIIPVFEANGADMDYCKRVLAANEKVCSKYVEHFRTTLKYEDPQILAQAASSVYSFFYYAPQKDYLEAFAGLSFSESSLSNNLLLKKRSIIKTILDRRPIWRVAELMINFPFPGLLYRMLKKRYFDSISSAGPNRLKIDF